MSKNSAKAKGYRKTTKKKPYLSKRDIIVLICIIAVIAIAVILINAFYKDGYMGAKDVKDGDIVTYATTNLKTRYQKLGEINELSGYTLSTKETADARVEYNFVPEDEASNIDSITVSGNSVEASKLTDDVMKYYSEQSSSEKCTTKIQGRDAYIFGYTYSDYVAPAEGEEAAPTQDPAATEQATTDPAATEQAAAEETASTQEPAATEAADAEADAEPAPNTFYQNLTAYVAYDSTHTLALHIYMSGDSEDFYIAEDQIVSYVESFCDAFTIYEPESDTKAA